MQRRTKALTAALLCLLACAMLSTTAAATAKETFTVAASAFDNNSNAAFAKSFGNYTATFDTSSISYAGNGSEGLTMQLLDENSTGLALTVTFLSNGSKTLELATVAENVTASPATYSYTGIFSAASVTYEGTTTTLYKDTAELESFNDLAYTPLTNYRTENATAISSNLSGTGKLLISYYSTTALTTNTYSGLLVNTVITVMVIFAAVSILAGAVKIRR